jgi:hypothetical protein
MPTLMRRISMVFFFLFFADWCFITGTPFAYVYSKDDFTQLIVIDVLLLLVVVISLVLPIIE